MVDVDNKILGKYFASIAAPIEYLGLDIDAKIKLLLKSKADFISLIIKELLEQEKGISKKYSVPYPKHIEELNGEERHKFFEKLIFDQEFPDTPDKILEQLSAIHMFYFVFSKIEMKPSIILLMAVDNLAMRAIYACGLSAKKPAIVREEFRIEESKIGTKKKKEIRAGIILKAIKRKNINPAKIPRGKMRVTTCNIKNEIQKMIDEGVLSDKELSSLKDKKPPCIDTIQERMKEFANTKHKKT